MPLPEGRGGGDDEAHVEELARDQRRIAQVADANGQVVPLGDEVDQPVREIDVELEPGIFGLLHISNIFAQPWGHHPSERFKLDQEVEVVVSKVDLDARRLAFVLPDSPTGDGLPQVTEEDEAAAEAATRWREGDEEDS